MRAIYRIAVGVFLCHMMLYSQTATIVATEDTIGYQRSVYDTVVHSNVSLRAFDPNFRSKYKGDNFDYTEAIREKSFFEKLLEKLFSPSNATVSDTWLTAIVWFIRIIVVLAVLYGVYILVTFWMSKQGNWLFTTRSDIKTVSYGTDDQDIIHNNYPSVIAAAVADGDYRLAVRYHYLYLLQTLVAKGIIAYHKDKTNAEYRDEIKNKKLAESFGYVSYIYDYTWYGAFEMSSSHYRIASDAFDETYKMSV